MAEKEQVSEWVYVFVCNPGAHETFLGLYNEEKEVNFIPTFISKEDANDCFLSMPREKEKKFELQAILIEELHAEATKNGFHVAMVDSDGNLMKKV